MNRELGSRRPTNQSLAEWDHKNNIFHDAEFTGADYYEASGELPSQEVMAQLHANGYIEYSPEEILASGVFHDWEDFQAFAKQKGDTQQFAAVQIRDKKIEEVQERIADGSIHPILAEKLNKTDGKVFLTGFPVDFDTLLFRYARYLIAQEFVPEKEDEEPWQRQQKLLGIVLGINLQEGTADEKGFFTKINSYNLAATADEVRESDIYRDWADVLHARDREKYLEEILCAAYIPKFFYNRRSRVLTMLGKTAHAQQYITNDPYLTWLKSKNKLFTRQALPKNSLVGKTVFPLAALINADDLENEYSIKREEKREVIRGKVDIDTLLAFGNFLIQIASGNDQEDIRYDTRLIENAHTLGLGPSAYQISQIFGDVGNFWKALGVANFKRDKHFKDYGLKDIADAVAQLGEKLGRKPTRQDMYEAKKRDIDFPSPHTMYRKGFTLEQIYDAAGWPDISKWETPDYDSYGVHFMLANHGLLPSQRSLRYLSAQHRGPSYAAISTNYPGGFKEWKKSVIQAYKQLLLEGDKSKTIDPKRVYALRLPDEMTKPKNSRSFYRTIMNKLRDNS